MICWVGLTFNDICSKKHCVFVLREELLKYAAKYAIKYAIKHAIMYAIKYAHYNHQFNFYFIPTRAYVYI